MEDTLQAQMVQQSMVVLFTTFTGNVALEASAYNADTRPFRNYYAENEPEAVSRYDRIYNRGFNLRSARPEDEADRVIPNEDEEANPLELRRDRRGSS